MEQSLWKRGGRAGLLAIGGAVFALGCATPDPWLREYQSVGFAEISGDHELAEVHLNAAIEHARKDDRGLGGIRGSRLSASYARYGEFLLESGDPARAAEFFAKGVAACKGRYGDENRRAALPLAREAEARARAGDVAGGIAAMEEVEEVWRPHQEIHDAFLGSAFTALGDGLLDAGAAQEAAATYRRSLEVRLFSRGSNRYDVALAWIGLADSLEVLGDEQGASEAREKVDWILQGSSFIGQAIFRTGWWRVAARWSDDDMPLSVHMPPPQSGSAADDAMLLTAAREAVLSWTGVAAPGTPSFEFVKRSFGADILVDWDVEADDGFEIGHARSKVKSDSPLSRVWISLPAVSKTGAKPSATTIRSIMLHEAGHALGMWGHSPYRGDVMFYRKTQVSELSPRDRMTLEELYEHYSPGESWQR